MKSKKTFKKREHNHRELETEIKIKERKKKPNKKFKKHNLLSMIEEEDLDIDLYGYLDEED